MAVPANTGFPDDCGENSGGAEVISGGRGGADVQHTLDGRMSRRDATAHSQYWEQLEDGELGTREAEERGGAY